ncbi:hypothetical protein GC175_33340 [bacterium]|nr:hypothetical protein [bacterium]
MIISTEQVQSIIDIIRRDPNTRRQLREALEVEHLRTVPDQMGGIQDTLAQLATAQLRGEERMGKLESTVQELVDSQKQLESTVQDLADSQKQLESTVRQLADAQLSTQQQLSALTGEVQKVSRWQFGEDGRRTGEQYERNIVKRASRLLGEGTGGAPDLAHVYQHIHALTQQLPNMLDLDPESDPMLADLIWWKGDHYAVVEISRRVDRLDVLRAARRAARRAATLRQANVDAIGVVIGEEWVADDTELLALEQSIAWKVGSDVSPLLMAFRQKAA